MIWIVHFRECLRELGLPIKMFEKDKAQGCDPEMNDSPTQEREIFIFCSPLGLIKFQIKIKIKPQGPPTCPDFAGPWGFPNPFTRRPLAV